ncbi:hypothetical protein BOTBODRAFT_284068 [Botryobasidium botryosum FD-172 SS1]|uniref:Uncharacterized protein n=1 Tax=Botryobasidium botryosum (strain FD-172 SS1) TaxID=930990 RepID=A0A067MUU2_BOTB1|nr:hypothetical protein BOTBODRAFT_284068 [Botryobasidium botryosum FD-172 SS1]
MVRAARVAANYVGWTRPKHAYVCRTTAMTGALPSPSLLRRFSRVCVAPLRPHHHTSAHVATLAHLSSTALATSPPPIPQLQHPLAPSRLSHPDCVRVPTATFLPYRITPSSRPHQSAERNGRINTGDRRATGAVLVNASTPRLGSPAFQTRSHPSIRPRKPPPPPATRSLPDLAQTTPAAISLTCARATTDFGIGA